MFKYLIFFFFLKKNTLNSIQGCTYFLFDPRGRGVFARSPPPLLRTPMNNYKCSYFWIPPYLFNTNLRPISEIKLASSRKPIIIKYRYAFMNNLYLSLLLIIHLPCIYPLYAMATRFANQSPRILRFPWFRNANMNVFFSLSRSLLDEMSFLLFGILSIKALLLFFFFFFFLNKYTFKHLVLICFLIQVSREIAFYLSHSSYEVWMSTKISKFCFHLPELISLKHKNWKTPSISICWSSYPQVFGANGSTS